MKVLFVYPNDYINIGIPQGIACLSAVLKSSGHTVDVFDYTFIKTEDQKQCDDERAGEGIFLKTDFTIEDLVADDPVTDLNEEFANKLEQFSPDLICLSAMTSTYDSGVALIEIARRRGLIKCMVIAGGVHPTIDPEDALQFEAIDGICIGEGERFIVELCRRISQGIEINDLENFGYRTGSGIKINPIGKFVDLNELPIPDWEIFDKRHLFRPFMGKIYNGGFYVMSRGCPFSCTYCVNYSLRNRMKGCGAYFRFQSPAKTISDLTFLKEKLNVTWLKFADDSIMGFNDEYLRELHKGLKPLDIMFGCSVRPETTTPDKVSLLKEMGCVAMSVGVESGNEELRRSVLNRRMTNDDITTAIKIITEHGIRVSTFNMIGLPGEGREDIFKTIQLNREMNVEACNTYIVYPYPGTALAQRCKTVYRDGNGNFIPVENAAEFALSKLSPAEIRGIMKVFNLYLKLPQELWPIIRIAEGNSKESLIIYKSLCDFLDKITQSKIDLRWE